MATSPATHPELYKSIILDGRASPGVVTLSNCEREHDWEQQKPKGQLGAVTINRGPANSEFTASFYLVDEDDLDAWDSFVAIASASAESVKPKALSVYHPDLARNRITSVVVRSVGVLQHDGKNGATCVLKFLEYRPAKPRPAVKPAAGKAQPTKADPNAKAKAELQALLDQAKAP